MPLAPPTRAFDSDDADFVADTRFIPGSAEVGAPDAHKTEAGDVSNDSAAVTRASDEPSRGEMATLADNWGRAHGDRPEMTIKSRAESSEAESAASLSRLETIPKRTLRSTERVDIQHPEYELVSVLGEGGMGIVWDARQTSVDRSVAVKMIKGPMAAKSSHREKFLAEAIVTGDLDHPNIVPIYDVGTDDRGTLFYSMKQVHGTPWQKVIRQKSQHENLEILMRVADAVAFAHDRGIVHRDLKPENVMLGAYGEVLVMDWGLAMPMPQFRKRRTLARPSMGGTPAYMAPEMATGPLERITAASDIYLLGAILYEIITGHPPHPGRKVKECLLGAMRNVIAPTEKTGELVDIAMRAMATLPSDRYPTVQAFQDALRGYLSHSESIVLSVRAEHDLAEAVAADDYTVFSKAVFGFEEAIDLWDGNREARDGLVRARQAYANSALHKGDYDLGLSLLDRKNPSHGPLVSRLEAARNERQARQQRLKFAKRAMTVMAVCLFFIVTGAFFWIRGERNIAELERDNARTAEAKAEERRVEADRSRQNALHEQAEAEKQRKIAHIERDNAEAQRKIAAKERDNARAQQELAEQARAAEEYESYIARIGLAAAKIDENAFDVAVELLEECPPELRNWEWGRLMHLCRQASRTFMSEAPVDAVALSPDGTQMVTGSWDRAARIRDAATGEVLQTLPHQGLYVHAVDWSDDGRYIATGGSDSQTPVQIWDARTGARIAGMSGHSEPVIGVRFSDNGRWLLSCSYDETARLWDLQETKHPREVCVLEGHNWWVWGGSFAPGFDPQAAGPAGRLATAGQDGKVILWKIATDGENVTASQRGVFYGHRGPVYAVAFAPDGSAVASAGYDRRILLWNPDDLQPFDFDAILEGEAVTADFRELSGHTGAVQAVRFSRDGALLVSGSRDNSVKVWDVESGTALKTFRGHYSGVSDVAFDPGGRRVVSAGRDHQTIVWSVDDYEEFRTLYGRSLEGHEDVVLSASFSADGRRIVTASRDRTARTWETSTGDLLEVYEEGHQYLASQAELLPGGRVLVTAAADDTVRLWDVATGAELRRLAGTGRSAALGISSDGRWLVTGSGGNDVLVWDIHAALDEEHSEPVARLAGHNAIVTAAAFQPESSLCLTADANGRSILWDVATGKPVWNVRHH
ncbi:MAG: protein kinase, partial [Maioricimonas sp. JB049]